MASAPYRRHRSGEVAQGQGIMPVYYLPAEVAAILRCSEWWVKEQARKRRIPYCWIGGSYRFTDEHLSAIRALFEVQAITPQAVLPVANPAPQRRTQMAGATVTPLRARTPPRVRAALAQQRSAA